MMTLRRIAKCRMHSTESASGQGIVELAISIPLLMLLMLGTIDMGRVFFDYIEMRQAAVEGATFGSRRPTDDAGIEAAMAAHGMPDDVTVGIDRAPECQNSNGVGDITVTASRVWTPIALNALEAISGDGTWTYTINASSTMRCMT